VTASSSETSVKIHQLIWRHVPEDSNFINTAVRNSNLHMAFESSTETSLTIHQSIRRNILQVAKCIGTEEGSKTFIYSLISQKTCTPSNIKSYEAPKVYRDYSTTGTDGFRPLWKYEV